MFTKENCTSKIACSAPLTLYIDEIRPFLLLYHHGERVSAVRGLYRYLRHAKLTYCKRLMEELYHEFKHTLDQ